ncbi:HK97-gp10 family putative phage morphogenesis protein [Crenobacter cavernae]|uniref:HK97 gp10 family phage protein n=1 Tax=Crenobacter cavernae TaxID=2290923 RepID=A0ABY0FE06_9NEIS|nr:HK97-gp10 family putative phage morphogenesis protein [Crenobacter cavernae]RXZ42708.1 HK97 gp10 family phage protein [Crenobacter cavernae]
MARKSQAKLYDQASVSCSLDDSIDQGLDELAARIENALRPAAHAAAVVLYEEIRQRVPVESGQLKSAIYRWHDEQRSTPGRQIYTVGVNKRRAPHWHNVEYGHWRVNKFRLIGGKWVPTRERLAQPVWVPGKPYIRPAFDAKIGAALAAAKRRLAEKLKDPDS